MSIQFGHTISEISAKMHFTEAPFSIADHVLPLERVKKPKPESMQGEAVRAKPGLLVSMLIAVAGVLVCISIGTVLGITIGGQVQGEDGMNVGAAIGAAFPIFLLMR